MLEILQKGKTNGAIESAPRSAAWKALAMHQKGARLAVESEQRRLLAAIGDQASTIEDLSGFVRRRVMEAQLTYELNISSSLSHATKRIRLEATGSFLYDIFTQQLDILYAQTDKVIRDCNMTSISDGDLTFRPSRKAQDDAEYFEYAFKQITLLDLKQTRGALWKVVHMLHRQDCREVLQGVKQSENSNTIALKFQINGHPASSTSLSEHIVVRRYDEEDRTILVWRSLTEGNGALSGMHSDKTGWCIIRPLEFGAIKETYVRQVPIYFSRAHNKRNISEFIILTHRTNEEDGIAIAQALV